VGRPAFDQSPVGRGHLTRNLAESEPGQRAVQVQPSPVGFESHEALLVAGRKLRDDPGLERISFQAHGRTGKGTNGLRRAANRAWRTGGTVVCRARPSSSNVPSS